jgi:hypothetical protein
LYLLDDDGCAGLIEEWQTRWMESMAGEQVYGFALPHDVPVVAVASDLQKVEGWPGVMQSYLEADFVVTPTRIIDLEIPQISTFNFVT